MKIILVQKRIQNKNSVTTYQFLPWDPKLLDFWGLQHEGYKLKKKKKNLIRM